MLEALGEEQIVLGEGKKHGHPYLSGNFAPVKQTISLTPCTYTGEIPEELAGGEYVRNGGNPVTNEALGRDAHWFDGDGMLSGVSFRRSSEKGEITPEFVNQYVLTDVYISSTSSPFIKTPILPSIATLVNPMSSLLTIILRIFRTVALVILSHLPGSQQAIRKISVANTAVIYHDGRALATCESGPPMRFSIPGLETIGWFNGRTSEGEGIADFGTGFGGKGLLSWMREWATAHPRVDPVTKELILYHSTFVPPYINYSIVAPTYEPSQDKNTPSQTRILNTPVPGISSAKMMHDFGVSSTHTIIMDLPLSLDPVNLAKNRPVVEYDPTSRSRFGIFPRYLPQEVRWFETKPCCIFHTANSWNSTDPSPTPGLPGIPMVNMLACRLTSASLVFSAGNLAVPMPTRQIPIGFEEEEQCRLYYYQFCLLHSLEPDVSNDNLITHQWALSTIPFEFPSLRDSQSMSAAKYIYGCSVSGTSFGAALGRAVKINALVKVDVETLIQRGISDPPTQITGCVDTRSIADILASKDSNDPIKIFKMPEGWYTQESRFVPRSGGLTEDDGWLLTYVFDESQLVEDGECKPDAKSELWVIDANNMTNVVARVHLPQRVPYGLHGNWFSEADVQGQRPVNSTRTMPPREGKGSAKSTSPGWRMWMAARTTINNWLQ
ncbi:hypothetical protein N7G274_004073 [Stereocaulon virgatum]|uniref:Carotenoid oxygenase n=1 Tax=Stereocaulon virgatum TaxID=373712 RepID=A0ABR4ABY2_9LECA